MIVTTELRDVLNAQGVPTRQLVLSYINEQGGISFLTYDIPVDQLYQWKYAKRGDVVDPAFMSWDFKAVKKDKVNGYLSDQRIHEILLDIISANPAVNVINELHMPKTYFCDIEVDVDNGFPEAADARNPVNTISWVFDDQVYVFGRKRLSGEEIQWIQQQIDEHCSRFDTKYKFTYICHEDEVELLTDFFQNHVKNAPCITGWNFFGYDWPYLYNRCKNLGIDISYISPSNTWYNYRPQNAQNGESISLPKHKFLYDYMEIYVKWDKSVKIKESNKLDWVADHVLGVKKVEHALGFAEEWAQKPAEYIFYNGVDSILVKEIDNSIRTSGAFMGLANLMHVDALTAFSPVRSLEIVQTEYLYKEHRVFPVSNKKKDTSDESYEGAFVYQPIAGIYKNVIALDFASLYPTTMRQFNISPDTYIKNDKAHKSNSHEIKCVSGAIYQKDFEGFIPKILTDFYMQRKTYKKEMMIAIKEKFYLEEIYEKRFGKSFVE